MLPEIAAIRRVMAALDTLPSRDMKLAVMKLCEMRVLSPWDYGVDA